MMELFTTSDRIIKDQEEVIRLLRAENRALRRLLAETKRLKRTIWKKIKIFMLTLVNT